MLNLFSSILYWPIVDTCFGMLNCYKAESGDYVHQYFPDQVCYSGIHILHAAMGIFWATVFWLFTVMQVLIYYEKNPGKNNPGSQTTSRVSCI